MDRRCLVFGLLILVLVLPGCDGGAGKGVHSVVRQVVEGVLIEEVRRVELTDYYEATGTLRARTTSYVSSKIMGEVDGIKVNVGERVKKGDVLLTISSPDIAAKVRAGQEALREAEEALGIAGKNRKLAEKTFERFSRLYQEKAVTEQEFDEIRTRKEIAVLRYKSAQSALKRAGAALGEAKAYRNYSVIRSPIDGTVAEKKIDTGSMASPGKPLFIIEGFEYRVEVPVDERLMSSVHVGDPVEITVDALGLDTTGKTGEIVHRVDPHTRTFLVKVDINETGRSLRGGLYARVKIPVGKESYIAVNEHAIVKRGELKGAYTADKDGVITFRLVKTGKQINGMTEILSGLSEGDRIIVDGTDRAVDGGVLK